VRQFFNRGFDHTIRRPIPQRGGWQADYPTYNVMILINVISGFVVMLRLLEKCVALFISRPVSPLLVVNPSEEARDVVYAVHCHWKIVNVYSVGHQSVPTLEGGPFVVDSPSLSFLSYKYSCKAPDHPKPDIVEAKVESREFDGQKLYQNVDGLLVNGPVE
jgi:hypothetical protein